MGGVEAWWWRWCRLGWCRGLAVVGVVGDLDFDFEDVFFFFFVVIVVMIVAVR